MNIFEQLKSDGLAGVEKIVSDKTPESPLLEFNKNLT